MSRLRIIEFFIRSVDANNKPIRGLSTLINLDLIESAEKTCDECSRVWMQSGNVINLYISYVDLKLIISTCLIPGKDQMLCPTDMSPNVDCPDNCDDCWLANTGELQPGKESDNDDE